MYCLFVQVLVVFVGSTQTKDDEQIPLPGAVAGLIAKGVEIIPVGMGKNFDPNELKAIASDPKAVFPQEAVDPLKRAVKKAALTPPKDQFPGKKIFSLCLQIKILMFLMVDCTGAIIDMLTF